MKTIGTLIAAAGVAVLMSFGAASAQTPTSGTGAATQQDKPSTAGMSNPGGPMKTTGQTMGSGMSGRSMHHGMRHRHMMKKKMMMMRHHRMHHHHRHMMMKKKMM